MRFTLSVPLKMVGDTLKDLCDVPVSEFYATVRRAAGYKRAHDADDLAHEVLQSLLTRARSNPTYFKDPKHVLCIAFLETQHVWSKRHKKQVRSKVVSNDVDRVADNRPSEPESEPVWVRQRHRTCPDLMNLLPETPPEMRLVFLPLCRRVQTQSEVAASIGKSLSTVRRRWEEAQEYLRENLELLEG